MTTVLKKSLKKKIRLYFKTLSFNGHPFKRKDKQLLSDGFNAIRNNIFNIRKQLKLKSLRPVKIYLFDSENIGFDNRHKHSNWDPQKIITIYKDIIQPVISGPLRIPLIFLYKNRYESFISACKDKGISTKEIKNFIFIFPDEFAEEFRKTTRHFSPDDMQIIIYANLLKMYMKSYNSGNCELCIKNVIILSNDNFNDHKDAIYCNLKQWHTKNKKIILNPTLLKKSKNKTVRSKTKKKTVRSKKKAVRSKKKTVRSKKKTRKNSVLK